MQEIKVLVPEERVPAFYKWFGEWLSGKPDEAHTAPTFTGHWLAAPDPALRAESAWKALSGSARPVISALVDEPGKYFTSEELVALLDSDKGVHGLAGVLGGAGRAFNKAGIPDAWVWDGSSYWMDPRIAELLRAARDAQESER